jgi:hypothetical protein
MSADKSLAVYLTDHMAGSVSASDLARRGARNNDGALASFFEGLSREIEADRRTLSAVAARVGARKHALKEAAAVAAERLSRFKIHHRMTGSPALSRLLELELLYLGISGKHALWQTLRVLAESDRRLTEFDFGQLARRAQQQLAAVEEQRIAAAASAFPAD